MHDGKINLLFKLCDDLALQGRKLVPDRGRNETLHDPCPGVTLGFPRLG